MLTLNKTETVTKQIQVLDEISINSLKKVKIPDVIRFNLGVAYFIILTFLLMKLLFT